ncbi:hypothetical protein ACQPZQ_14325 [Pseudonocardia sp. CA-142604]|uniref:hypothetical protein n=1 Tax=Pseudonocardia sp. CA-142604 TaxID=3240024 RepID=UPI003D9382A4
MHARGQLLEPPAGTLARYHSAGSETASVVPSRFPLVRAASPAQIGRPHAHHWAIPARSDAASRFGDATRRRPDAEATHVLPGGSPNVPAGQDALRRAARRRLPDLRYPGSGPLQRRRNRVHTHVRRAGALTRP